MKRRRRSCFFRDEQLDGFGERPFEGARPARRRRLGDEPGVGAGPLDHRRRILRGGRRCLADRGGEWDEEGDRGWLHDRRDALVDAERCACGVEFTEYVRHGRHRQAGKINTRNTRRPGNEDTQTAADTSGTAAEKTEQQTSPPIENRVANSALQGAHSEITAAREATGGIPSGFVKRLISLRARGAWVSEVVRGRPRSV